MQLKIAVLYLNEPKCIISEDEGPLVPTEDSKFWTFMDAMGGRINTKGWTKYLGDFKTEGEDTEKDTYYLEWNKIEVIYHLAPWLTPEQHRRLIGNDVNVIIFLETKSNKPFDESSCEALGKIPQVFVLVSVAEDDKYKISFFRKTTLPAFDPLPPPLGCTLTLEEAKDFILKKCYNGYQVAYKAPPLDRLYVAPRENEIQQLCQKYPRKKGRRSEKKISNESADVDASKRKALLELQDFLCDEEGEVENKPLLHMRRAAHTSTDLSSSVLGSTPPLF
eukprot:TRINITY_DN2710_c0_g1_i2.p2 TRINITY_DN2710_c0_g1~~TRINITY_DN2710_c0_g1_i2.p2  ORF type:complete len:278 (+),score=69.54 TRINITY_DN2710_c0_g1_i2:1118-1951(+)